MLNPGELGPPSNWRMFPALVCLARHSAHVDLNAPSKPSDVALI